MAKELFATLLIPGVTPGEVWPMLTDAQRLTHWFCASAEVDLQGGIYHFWGRFTPDTPEPDATVITLEMWAAPDSAGHGGQLNYTWLLREQETVVAITLEPQGEGTVVKVHHSALGERLNSKGAVHDFWYSVLANLRLYALTGRQQQLVEYGAMTGSRLEVEVEIAAPAERIFRYLIEPQSMGEIWGEDTIKVEPQVGGVYDYGWAAGGPRRILALDPPHLLSFTWLYPPETEESTVTWQLTELGAGITRLSLTHEGFAPGTDHEEYRAGWFSFLAIIKGLNELGERWTKIDITGSPHGEA